MLTGNEFIGYVYLITNTINSKLYVGITTRSMDERFREHKYDHKYSKSHLYRAMRKYGFDNFLFSIIEEVKSSSLDSLASTLFRLERYYIDLYDTYKNGYNSTLGGDGCVGFHLSEEAKKKISRIHKGKTISDEHRKKISEFMSSDKNPNLGKHMSDEDKKRSSLAHKGKCQGSNNGMYGKSRPDLSQRNLEGSFKIIQLTLDSNKVVRIWDSLRQIQRETGWNRSCISDCCNGKSKYSHGYIWKYFSELKENK